MRSAHNTRIPELDGFRAIAVLCVIAYHYFQRFPQIYPYGDALLPAAKWGFLGVEFFFMISGFVIALSLERTPGWRIFALRRAFRLVPPVMVASVITALVVTVLGSRLPAEMQPDWVDFLPSWTLTDPALWRWLAPDIRFVDGAYWSLFVELRFYIWAALLHFALPRIALPWSLVALLGLALLAQEAGGIAQEFARHVLITDYLALFVFGALMQALWRRQTPAYWGAALMVAGVALWARPLIEQGATLAMIAAFVALIWARWLLRPLGTIVLQFYGRISYSLYLLHQMIGVTLISHLPPGLSATAYLAAVALIFAGVTALAWGLYRCIEQPAVRVAHRRLAPPAQ